MGVRAEQRRKRRQQILEAALDLFITKGYAATKISDIAKASGMSTGLLFHYFASKAALYEALFEMGASWLSGVMNFDDADPLCFFNAVAGFILSALREDAFVAKMFVLESQAGFISSVPAEVRKRMSSYSVHEKSAAVIRAGQACGQLRAGEPMALSILFWQALSGVALYVAVFPGAPLPSPEWIIDSIRR